MKNLLVVVALFVLVSVAAFGQSAVYMCTETGAIGYAYDFDASEVKQEAYNKCLEYGGTTPQLVVFTEQDGWGAIAVGEDDDGYRIIGSAVGWKTLAEAKKNAIKQCKEYGGNNPEIVASWNDQ